MFLSKPNHPHDRTNSKNAAKAQSLASPLSSFFLFFAILCASAPLREAKTCAGGFNRLQL
jgi:hypothetical protein